MDLINESLQGTSTFVSSAAQIGTRFKEVFTTSNTWYVYSNKNYLLMQLKTEFII
jgi:hypothetical protein